MSETLYYKPAYDTAANALVEEFDYQVPEYINPEWQDDALYNLICANQDVLVNVGGEVMTLSAAMNQHPGPWTPENESNLIAYAEKLLVGVLIEPEVPIEEILMEAENEPVFKQHQTKDHSELKIEEPAMIEYRPETLEPQQIKITPIQNDSSIAQPESAKPTFTEPAEKASSKVIRPSREFEARPSKLERVSAPDVITISAEPDDRTDNTEQISEPTLGIKIEEPQTGEVSQSEEIEPLDTTKLVKADVADDIYIENETAVDDTMPDVEYEQADELVDQDVLENEHEVSFDVPEFYVDEVPAALPPDYDADIEGEYQTNTIEDDRSGQVIEMAGEVDIALLRLTELIGSDEIDDEETNAILNNIFEAPTNLAIDTREEWAVFYVEIFEAAGIAYTPELIERLSALTVERNLFDEIERLDDVGNGLLEGEDGGRRTMVRKLLAAIASIIQTIRHVFTIGTYVLGLSLASKAGYQ